MMDYEGTCNGCTFHSVPLIVLRTGQASEEVSLQPVYSSPRAGTGICLTEPRSRQLPEAITGRLHTASRAIK
jgi:hypothetical protein